MSRPATTRAVTPRRGVAGRASLLAFALLGTLLLGTLLLGIGGCGRYGPPSREAPRRDPVPVAEFDRSAPPDDAPDEQDRRERSSGTQPSD